MTTQFKPKRTLVIKYEKKCITKKTKMQNHHDLQCNFYLINFSWCNKTSIFSNKPAKNWWIYRQFQKPEFVIKYFFRSFIDHIWIWRVMQFSLYPPFSLNTKRPMQCTGRLLKSTEIRLMHTLKLATYFRTRQWPLSSLTDIFLMEGSCSVLHVIAKRLCWGDVTQFRVPTHAIIKYLDIFHDFCTGGLTIFIILLMD